MRQKSSREHIDYTGHKTMIVDSSWNLLECSVKDEPKWKAYASMLDEEGCSKGIKVSASRASVSSSNQETITSGDIGSFEVHNVRPAKKPARCIDRRTSSNQICRVEKGSCHGGTCMDETDGDRHANHIQGYLFHG